MRSSAAHPTLDRLSLRRELRAATDPAHRALEARLSAADGMWTRARYAQLLHVTHRVVAPIEAALDTHLGSLFTAPSPATRAERLRSDLERIGCEVAARAPADASVRTREDALGAGYVLQGSLLGGALIARALRADPATAHLPTTYLSMYGDRLGAMWRRYCAALDGFGESATTAERALVLRAARRTFAAYDQALEERSIKRL